jgi:hypothetical protein
LVGDGLTVTGTLENTGDEPTGLPRIGATFYGEGDVQLDTDAEGGLFDSIGPGEKVQFSLVYLGDPENVTRYTLSFPGVESTPADSSGENQTDEDDGNIAEDLLARYRFEGDGADSHGENHLTLVGTSVSYSTAAQEGDYAIDTSDRGFTGDIPSPSGVAHSMCGWFRVDSLTNGTVLVQWRANRNSTSNWGNNWHKTVFRYTRNSDTFMGNVIGSSADRTTWSDYVIGEWKHFALTCDDSNVRLYIDSVEVDSVPSLNSSFAYDTVNIGFNSENYPPYFDGQLDDVRFYDRALNASEVRDIYNGRR